MTKCCFTRLSIEEMVTGVGTCCENNTGFLGLEDDPPPKRGTPPTAYTSYGIDLKCGRNTPLENTFGTIEADF